MFNRFRFFIKNIIISLFSSLFIIKNLNFIINFVKNSSFFEIFLMNTSHFSKYSVIPLINNFSKN